MMAVLIIPFVKKTVLKWRYAQIAHACRETFLILSYPYSFLHKFFLTSAVVVPFREFCTVLSLLFFTEFVGRVPFRSIYLSRTSLILLILFVISL